MKNRLSLTTEYMALFRALESSRPEMILSRPFSFTNGVSFFMDSHGLI
jgi:hypothetical protein